MWRLFLFSLIANSSPLAGTTPDMPAVMGYFFCDVPKGLNIGLVDDGGLIVQRVGDELELYGDNNNSKNLGGLRCTNSFATVTTSDYSDLVSRHCNGNQVGLSVYRTFKNGEQESIKMILKAHDSHTVYLSLEIQRSDVEDPYSNGFHQTRCQRLGY